MKFTGECVNNVTLFKSFVITYRIKMLTFALSGSINRNSTNSSMLRNKTYSNLDNFSEGTN